MKRFVEEVDRGQSPLFAEYLDDWIDEDNPVRVIDVFVDALDLGALDFGGVDPKATGRPWYHPSILLKLYVYGYLNRVQSNRRLEREAGRNVEVMWLTGLGRYFPTVTEDRPMATQISKLAELVLDGQIVTAVEDKGDYFTDFALQHQD